MAAQHADHDGEGGPPPQQPTRARRSPGAYYWLLLLPFLALLYPPVYAHDSPRVFGIPFFYWYQLVWLIVTAAIITFVYRRTR